MTAQIQSSAEEKIIECERMRYAAILNGDTAVLEELFDDNLIYTHSSGVVDSKSSYLDAIKSGALVYDAASFETQKVVQLSRGEVSCYLAISDVKMEVSVHGEMKHLTNRGNGVWLDSGGVFKMVMFAATPIAPV